MGFPYRDLYSKPLEIYNSLYQIIGWTNLEKTRDFKYLEFVSHVKELGNSNQANIEIQLLISYIEVWQYRLLNIPPKDDKNLVCVDSFLVYISRRILTNRMQIGSKRGLSSTYYIFLSYRLAETLLTTNTFARINSCNEENISENIPR